MTFGPPLEVQIKASDRSLQSAFNSAAQRVKQFETETTNSVKKVEGSLSSLHTSILALGAAWGAFRVGQTLVTAGMQMQALEAKMAASTGSANAAAASLAFVRAEAERLGLDLRTTAAGFASFAASGLRSGLTFEEVKSIFSGVSEAATGMRLSAERTSLVFMALSQMASKGQVSMEELRQQLGESLPGALQVFAKSMGVGTAEFIKMVENGRVTTRDLIKLGDGLRNEFGGAAEEAARGAQAAFNRLGNAVFELQNKLASSGLLDTVVLAVQSLTTALNDPALVSGLSQLVSFLSKVMEIALRVASAIGAVVGAINRAIEAAGNSVFGALFGKEGSAAIEKARGPRPVKLSVQPGGVEPGYTLGTASSPGVSDASKRAAELRERLRGRVKDMAAGFITEDMSDSDKAISALEKRYQDEQDILQQALEKKAITEQEFREYGLKAELDYQARLAEIREQYREDFLSQERAAAEGFLGVQLDMQKKTIGQQAAGFRQTIAQAAQHNRVFFAIEKAAALARATIAAAESVVNAYRFGSALGGPVLGATFAGIAASAQASNIAAIASASFGGGNASASSGGGFSGSGGVSDTGSSEPAGPRSQVFITLQGSEGSTFTKQQIRGLIEQINDAGRDGSTFNVALA